MKKLLLIIRDLTLFGLLLLLIKMALDRKTITYPKRAAVLSALYEDGKADFIGGALQDPEPIEFNLPAQDIGEQDMLDLEIKIPQSMMDFFVLTNQHIEELIQRTSKIEKEAAQLESIRQRLAQLKKNYEQLMASAPETDESHQQQEIKLAQIENHLLRITQLIGRMARLHLKSTADVRYQSIEHGLQANEKLIALLREKANQF